MKITLDTQYKPNIIIKSSPKLDLQNSRNNNTYKTVDTLLSSAFFNSYKISFSGKKDFALEKMDENNSKWEQATSRLLPSSIKEDDYRSDFKKDYGRIVHSQFYEQLQNKTQVVFDPSNDSICTRINHVQQVADIARTISKQLGLNEELAEAIAMGHDIGHTPFGHQGEFALKKLCKKYNLESFWHGRNGLKVVDNFSLLSSSENNLKNMNLTYAVRDGIIAHSGKFKKEGLKPRNEAVDLNLFIKKGEYNPFTWEGCIVKISDEIAYIGRDIEDAFKTQTLNKKNAKELKQIQKEYFPEKDFEINNTNLIHFFISDLVKNSNVEDGLKFSDKAYDFLYELRAYNSKHIYYHPKKTGHPDKYFELLFNTIFEVYDGFYDGKNTINKLNENKQFYPVKQFNKWLKDYSNVTQRDKNAKNTLIYNIENRDEYRQSIVDFISAMTDRHAKRTYEKIIFENNN